MNHPRFSPGTFFAPLRDGHYVGDGIRGTLITGEVAAAIPLINGRRDESEIALTLDLPTSTVRALLSRLVDLGYLANVRPPAGVVAIYGSDTSAQLLALNLFLSGVKDLLVMDHRLVTLADSGGALLTPAEVGKPFSIAVTEKIHEIAFLSCAKPHIAPKVEDADLYVSTEPFPPEVEAEAMRTGRPHLTSSTWGSAITLGPLVLPGSTGCLRCQRLRIRDNDAHADAIERGLYLANVSQLAPLPLAQLAASLHALAIQEFFKAATSPHPLANTVLTITSTLDVSSRSFKPHPRCGCTWNQKSAPNQGTGL
ncbi:MAG: TOMM precursor leader peptide-binding protein [Actinomycetes bacterium]